ncbi:MAG: tRNA epoxyqueuosine(34) reductase QueG [Bacteroidetes bacterium GWE2_29_8]|nr:MAG: tRNA epoxyqueuosine(34) reductase QueG [Bacteroidetes bacterium GWE2_29_8]OFY14342.1 MAG: tRNA epoxyqueuosine(34) reductase QueG [Bacteroidetes bacterium GWF2_29_10]
MTLKQDIKDKAFELGFTSCGFAQVEKLDFEKQYLSEWTSKGHHGNKKYLQDNIETRTNPELLLSGAKTVISLAINYYPGENLKIKNFKIAKYATGIDYHYVLKEKLNTLANFIKNNSNCKAIKVCVDSIPIMERSWAVKAGIGWRGKNNCIIIKNKGSFFFLSEIITDVEFEYDKPYMDDYCGECRKCIESCPTNALYDSYKIDIRNCISYLTLESDVDNEKNIDKLKKNNNNYIVGCDICQDVCPWNQYSSITKIETFSKPYFNPENINQAFKSKSQFNKFFKSSPILRLGYKKFIAILCVKTTEND